MARDRYLQAVRGAAIVAVVLIHCLPQCALAIALRPFLNWAVAVFLFLSGFLTTEEKVAAGGVSMVLSTIAAFVFQHGPSGRRAPLLR